jgi:DNA-binding GntR family transcriptional regulator
MAELLGVSKTPVREALLRLREGGLIEPDGRRGLRVTKLTGETLHHIMDLREALERHCAGKAALNADDETRKEILEAAHGSLKEAEQGSNLGFHFHDRMFHAAMSKAVRNPKIQQQIENAVTLARMGVRRESFPSAEALIACAQRHVLIAEAICSGDATAAEHETVLHIRYVHELINKHREK